MPRNDSNVILEDVRLLPGSFRNFSGRETQYNRAGDRNFAVLLGERQAKAMEKDGWNIKWTKAREEGDAEEPYLSVTVKFGGRPPKIVMITSHGRTMLDEATVETLDWVDMVHVDMIIRPYEWVVNGKTGIKAYLQSIYVTIEEDALELKYSDVGDARVSGGRDERDD